jgi:hypothetical protein
MSRGSIDVRCWCVDVDDKLKARLKKTMSNQSERK